VVYKRHGPRYLKNVFPDMATFTSDGSWSAPAILAQGTWLADVVSGKTRVHVERAVVDACLLHHQDKLEEAFRQMAALREENDALRAQATTLLEEAKDETAEAPASEELQVFSPAPVAHLLHSHNMCLVFLPVYHVCLVFLSHCSFRLNVWVTSVFCFHGRSTPC
jgi:hypothetical protein